MPEVNFIKRLDAAPDVATAIHDLAAPAAPTRALLGFAGAFGADSKTGRLSQDPRTLSYTVGAHRFTLHRASGALRYQDHTRWQVDDHESDVQIRDEEAVRLALGVVERHGLAPTAELVPLKVARLIVGTSDAEARVVSERAIDVSVALRRTVGGVPVDGPGGIVVVYLDHAGEMTGFDRVWRPIAGVRAPVRELKDPAEAERDLLAHVGDVRGRIDVTDVRFGYFEFGYDEKQKVLQPAYVMMYTMFEEKDERIKMKSVHVVAAATNAVGTFTPPRKRPVSQPTRTE